MADAMNYKPGDLPDLKYASESLIPRVIGCTCFYPLGVVLFVCEELSFWQLFFYVVINIFQI